MKIKSLTCYYKIIKYNSDTAYAQCVDKQKNKLYNNLRNEG